MNPKSNVSGWRGLSLSKQADIATAAPVNTSFYYEGDPMEPEPETQFTNDGEVTGELLPTQHRLLSRKFSGTHKSKAFPHLVGLFASMAMGKDTVSQVATSSAYKHKLEIDKSIVELPYRSLIENDGLAQFLYTGVSCVGFTISGQRGGFVEIEAELMGRASEAVDATAKPARVQESYLAYGDITLTKGGTFDGSAVTGGTSLSAALKSFKLSFKNNGQGVYLCGDSTGYVGQIRRGQKYAIEFEADFDLEDQTHRTDLLAGTEFVVDLPIVGGVANGSAKYTVDVVLPKVYYREAKKGQEDGILKVGAKFGVLADPTYGPMVINVINLQQTSYLAAAA